MPSVKGIVAVTGHRPDKLGGYSDEAFETLALFAELTINPLSPKKVLTGMALGWDQAIAEACWSLDIPFIAYVPCDGQETLWPEEAQQRYRRLLDLAEEVIVVSPGPYAAYKMIARDCRMVDALQSSRDSLLALYNGDTSGGTMRTVRYAESKNKQIKNCWQDWLEFCKVCCDG